MRSRCIPFLLLVGSGLVSLPGAVLIGQDPPDVETPPVAEVNPPDPTSADGPPRIHEQTIYIPYDKLRQVFEQEGRGVFLPYGKFQELWRAAQAQWPTPRETALPVEALIQQIDSDATIGDQVVTVRAALRIEVLGKGWGSVPLRLRDAAIRSALIGGQPARITVDPEHGHQLLYHKESDAPEQLELTLEYARAFTKTPGQSSVSFEAPQAPINRWRVRVPEPGMAVQIEPMIAATRGRRRGRRGRRGRRTEPNRLICSPSSAWPTESSSLGTRRPREPAVWRRSPPSRRNSRSRSPKG
jgi:hypothetical protein